MTAVADGRQRIVILGGGFAGAWTATYLERSMTRAEREQYEITIVSNENYMVFQPLLPEVVSGSIETLHCIAPLRRMARRAKLITREVEAIDLDNRIVRLAPGYRPRPLDIRFDHLIVCLGTRIEFARVPGAQEHAIPFKYLGDALRLRNDTVRVLEEADIESDPVEKARLLTFVVAGGGFSGVECMAELQGFIHDATSAYANVDHSEVRCILLQSGPRLLPELDADLAAYAQRILEGRGVEVRLNTRLLSLSADTAVVHDKATGTDHDIDSRTIVVTVPAAPNPLVEALPVEHAGGRITVTHYLNVVDHSNVWAVGDCAAVPQKDGIFSPPTAQHAQRQAGICADNVLACLRGKPMQRFGFTGLGSLASLGGHNAVADVMGVRLRGVIAWLAWRSIYLAKFPGFDRRLRIATDWILDIVLPRDITQLRIFHPEQIAHEHFHAGESVFVQGDYGNKLYVLLSGQVSIVRGDQTIATLQPGEVFGEMALVSDKPRNADVVAGSDVDVLSVSRPAFQKLVKYLPGTNASLVEIMRNRGIDPSGLVE